MREFLDFLYEGWPIILLFLLGVWANIRIERSRKKDAGE